MISLISICHKNIGDDISAKCLRGYIETYTRIPTTIVSYDDPYLSQKIGRSVAVVVGTGGMFGSFHNRPVFNFDYSKLNIPVFIISSGFNFGYDLYGHNIDFYNKTIQLFNKAEIIGLRTELGCEAARYFIDNEKVTLSPDPLHFIGYNKDGKRIGFINCFNMSDIYYKLGKYNPVCIEHESFTTRITEYDNLGCVVTGRFHGAVIASAFGIPFFNIVSNHKHLAINKMFYGHDTNTYCYYNSQQEFDRSFERFYNNLDHYRDIVIKRRDELRKPFFQVLEKLTLCLNFGN